MRAAAAVVATLALLTGACSDESGSIGDAAATSEPASADVVDDQQSQSASEQHPSDYIFDQERLHTFELTLSEEALAEIDADPVAEEYVEGSLTFEGETLERVGIRYKGSIGAFVGCLTGQDFTQPSGSKTCTKLSMKVKINWEDPDDEFFGLRKLQFHSQNLDRSQMHERLGYWLFREMGVPAPRSVHARLVVNDEYVGLFALTEQIDGRFTRYNFADGTGNLYKEVWPLDDAGEPHPSRVYLEGLRTNEDENPSAERIRQFASEVAAQGADALGRWMDIDEVMAFVAVDRAIRNDDGPFHWYCMPGGSCGSHNFYWYEDPSTETFHLIPWDLDNAFENIERDVNPVTPIGDEWGEITADCEPFSYGGFGILQRSAACDPLTAAMVAYDDEYRAAIDDLLSGPLAKDRVETVLDEWEAQIADATEEAADAHSDAVGSATWRSGLAELREQLDHARGE